MKTKLYRLLELASLLVLFLAQQTVQGQSFTTLYTFTGGADGSGPSGLTLDSAGNLYGLAFRGGDLTCESGFGCGTVFKLDLTGQLTVLHNFTGSPDGDGPSTNSTLFRDARGNLYGTTSGGGAPINSGTVFRVDATGKEKVLHRFTNLAGGLNPVAGVIRDAAGNLYGTTQVGGDASCNDPGPGCGVVFKLDPRGTQTVLYRFRDSPDGQQPDSGLTRDAAGNLYGTTAFGGQCGIQGGCGTVFKVDATGQETILYTFTGGADGGVPFAGLVRDATGNLYGATAGFGTYDDGTVFKLDTSGKETVLYSFKGGADGETPLAGLVRSPDGSLYGTTAYGGGNPACDYYGCGTVFKLDPHGHEIVLHSFTGADGAHPNAVLVRDSAGNLYGTTTGGGDPNCGCGTVFMITP
jgi:uncharacterized repeat protein (TIGR03803 family)